MKRVPFVPLPLDKALKISKFFIGIGARSVKLFPNLSLQLTQAEINLKDREYIAIAFFAMIFWFAILISVFFALNIKYQSQNILRIGLLTSVAIGVLSFSYVILYPKLLVSKKVVNIEKNLLFAIRHLLVQVKSGVSLSDAIASVSKGNYGLVAEECSRCIKNISTGKSLVAELEEIALRNPSVYFRRVVWQIVNSLKAGADIGDTLSILVENLSNEQKILIRRYGSQLNPLALMYMMLAVIIPTLGITFIISLSSFSGLQVPQFIFYLILIVLAGFQFMFIGMVKSRRPAVEL